MYLYSKKFPTAVALAKELGIPRGRRPFGGKIINWGWSSGRGGLNDTAVRDKLRQLQLCRSYSPNFWDSLQIIPRERYPVLGRRRSHSRGSDIRYCASPLGDTDSEFYVKYMSKAYEYRVHVFRGEVLSVTRKIPPAGLDTSRIVAWNAGNGFTVKTVVNPESIVSRLKEIALECCRLTNHDFGAVDIIRTPENGLYFLEVNSAPSLSPRRLMDYAEAIRGWGED